MDVKDVTVDQAREMKEDEIETLLTGKTEEPAKAGEPSEEAKAAAASVQADEAKRVADEAAAAKAIQDKADADRKSAEAATKTTADEQKVLEDRAKTEGKTLEELKAQVAKEAAEKAAPPAEKLLAGKYKTPEELLKATTEEIVKPLGYSSKILEIAVEQAKKSGDYEPVERLYKELESELGRKTAKEKAEAEAKAAQEKEQPPAVTLPPETDAERQGREALILQRTFEDLAISPIAREMTAQGLKVPESEDDIRELYKEDPWTVGKYAAEFQKIYGEYTKIALDHRKAVAEVGPHNETVKSAEVKKILDLAKEYGLDSVKLEDVEKFVESTYKTETLLEDRTGVKFYRSGQASREWFLENYRTILKKVKADAEMTGRVQHEEDIKELKALSVKSISTTPVAAKPERTAKPKVDIEDVRQRALLTDEEIEERLRNPELNQ